MMYPLHFDLLPSHSKPRNLLKVFVIASQPWKMKALGWRSEAYYLSSGYLQWLGSSKKYFRACSLGSHVQIHLWRPSPLWWQQPMPPIVTVPSGSLSRLGRTHHPSFYLVWSLNGFKKATGSLSQTDLCLSHPCPKGERWSLKWFLLGLISPVLQHVLWCL